MYIIHILSTRRAGRFHMLGMITWWGGAYNMDDDEGWNTNLQILRQNKRLNDVIVLLLYNIILVYCII